MSLHDIVTSNVNGLNLMLQNVTTEQFNARDMDSIFSHLTKCIENKHYLSAKLTTSLFRILRNLCIDSSFSNSLMTRKKFIWDEMFVLFEKHLSEKTDDNDEILSLLRCAVQSFGNLITSYPKCKQEVWNKINCHMMCLICGNDVKLASYACMVLHNFLLPNESFVDVNRRLERFLSYDDIQLLLNRLTDLAIEHQSEFSLFVLQRLLTYESNDSSLLLEKYFHLISSKSRIILLDILIEMISKSPSFGQFNTNGSMTASLKFFSNHFTENVQSTMLKLSNIGEDHKMEISVIVKSLQLLCDASAHDVYKCTLQSDSSLLEVSISILRGLVLLGKSEGTNNFTPHQSLDSLHDEMSSPTDGFKKDIIRLMANLCCGHRENQDKVRNLDGIMPILDSCTLDARNPYITQWCVFAIRNLCRNNLENQRIIAEVQSRGPVVRTAITDELNIRLPTNR